MTGTIGNGNLEAAMKLYSNTPALRPILNRFPIRFHLRKAEAEVIRKFASCCIDTSDGVLKALQAIADLNGVGFVAEDLPYSMEGLFVTRLIGKPHELLFLGESGEYELLFSVSPEMEETLLKEAGEKKLMFHKIGCFTESAEQWMKDRGRMIDLRKFRFSARDFPDAGKYLEILIKTLSDESHKQ
jgi:thiamine-monophosphate kinase